MNIWNLKSILYHYFRESFPFKQILDAENSNFRKLLQAVPFHPGVVVDIGSGTGNILKQVTSFWGEASERQIILAVDRACKMIQLISKTGVACPLIADACLLPIKNETSDLVCAIGITEYLSDLELFIREVARISKPGAWIVVSVSPQNLFFYLRKLHLSALYVHSAESILEIMENQGFALEKQSKTLMQTQFLFQKSIRTSPV